MFQTIYLNINYSRIVFTPQGSDILVLPKKNKIVRNFLSKKLCKLAFKTADSNILLDKVLEISPELNKKKLDEAKLFIDNLNIDESIAENFLKTFKDY